MSSKLPDPPAPFLEPAALQLTKDTAGHPRNYELPPAEGRAGLIALQAGAGVEKPQIDEEWVEVDAGKYGRVRARIVRPKGSRDMLPVFMFIHGAGWVFGDETTHDRLVRELVVESGAAAVFPVYDLAPEAKYPTQIEQNYAVGKWIVSEGPNHGLDVSRFAVCGDSVGGNMSAVFALMAKDRGEISLKAQILLYPVTNADFETASYQQFGEGYYLARDGMKWFWDMYTSSPDQRREKYASPLRASISDLKGLPPTLLITDEADVLRDEGEAYAAKLREAGVDVTSMRVLGMVHDFMMLDSLRNCRATNIAREATVDALRRALHK